MDGKNPFMFSENGYPSSPPRPSWHARYKVKYIPTLL
jgi:hypothetical protein